MNAWKTLGIVLACLWLASPLPGQAADMSRVIDHFVAKQFPGATSYFWVINAAQQQTEREVIVDLNTVVTPRRGQQPVEARFLLLIVGETLAGSQHIPLDAKTECVAGPT